MAEYVADTSTGEVIGRAVEPAYKFEDEFGQMIDSPIMRAIMSGQVPFFMANLINKYPDNLEQVEYEYSMFTGVVPLPFDDFINSEVTVLGCAFIPHDPFVGFDDGERHEGYVRAFILIDEKDDKGNNKVLVSSGVNVMPAMAMAMAAKGWYLWKKPTRYRISRGGTRKAFYIKCVDRPTPSANHRADPVTGRVTK